VICERWREAISAQHDGEDPGLAPELIERHLAGCAECRAFRRDLDAIRAPIRLHVPPPMPDLSRQVVKRNALLDMVGRWSLVRGLLAIVAVEIIVQAMPSLFSGHGNGEAAHVARHLGSFSIAYAVGLLVVVARPARARTMIPVAAVLAAALMITAAVDVFEGRVPLVGETGHLPEILSVPLLWLLAVPVPGWRLRRSEPGSAWHRSLRLVHGDERDNREQTG
jgi:predicted anti-sigma-YlaC factor YlaD